MMVETARSRDGTCIAFERGGVGPPVILVHGALVDRTCWRAVLPLLQRHCTTHALDRRGRDASGDTAPYAVEREVEDILAVLGMIDGPADLLGHSSGALLALHVATRAASLRRLMLYEPPLFFGAERRPVDLADRVQALVAAGDREVAARTFLREGPGRSDAEIEQMQRGPLWPGLVALAHTTPYDARVQADFLFDPARLRAVRVPTLLVLGGAGPAAMRASTETLAAALPHARVAVLPGQGHTAMFTAPELFAREVLRFQLAPGDG